MIISLFETVGLSVSISPRNLYNALKSIKERLILVFIGCTFHFVGFIVARLIWFQLTKSKALSFRFAMPHTSSPFRGRFGVDRLSPGFATDSDGKADWPGRGWIGINGLIGTCVPGVGE